MVAGADLSGTQVSQPFAYGLTRVDLRAQRHCIHEHADHVLGTRRRMTAGPNLTKDDTAFVTVATQQTHPGRFENGAHGDALCSSEGLQPCGCLGRELAAYFGVVV